jgi:hypothetical protein
MRTLLVAAVLFLSAGLDSRAEEFKLEEGYTLLFNGKDLTGWKTKSGESLDGKTETPEKRFKVKEGVLVYDEKAKGDIYIYTQKEFGKSLSIKFDFFPQEKCNNDLFIHGAKFDIKKEDVTNWKLGEWNSFEITVKNKKAEYKCNGTVLKTLNAKEEKSTFGLRAEIGPMQLKNLRIKEES